MKPVLGIVGGIGAGKSTVTGEFERLGCLVIYADRINEQLLTQPGVIRTIHGWWGDRVLNAAGGLDRQQIAAIVFQDAMERRRLESLLHPLIEQERAAIISRSIKDQAVKAIVLDSPLLLECDLDRHCLAVVFVDADDEVRQARVARSRNWDAAEWKRREQQQMSLDQKRARSRFIIHNNGSPTAIRSQVESILNQVLLESHSE